MTIPANCLSPPTTAAYIAVACMMVLVSAVVFGLIWYLKHIDRRDRQRWQREVELRHQLWELEQQIWRESLLDWQREAIEEVDRKRAEMKQEARRRLGLPEEAPPHANKPASRQFPLHHTGAQRPPSLCERGGCGQASMRDRWEGTDVYHCALERARHQGGLHDLR
jgi:hypothetical protein